MNILVTGGAGFIGSHLVDALVARDHVVSVVDNLSTGRRENLPPHALLHVVDVRDPMLLEELFARERPEVVFHLAAQMNVRKSLSDPREDADVNVLGSLGVFQAAFGSGARRVVFASSGGAIYGEQPEYPCRESDLPRPSSPYGAAKLAAEHYGRQCAESNGREFVALRLANVYGPRQNPSGEAGVVSLFLSRLLEGRPSTLFGDGGQTRDFVWVGDVVEAFVRALDAPAGIYNIGTGVETSVLELYRQLERASGLRGSLRQAAAIPGEVRRNVLCTEQARIHLGWNANRTILEGLAETVHILRSEY
jgi:UDP-glucose 4-epimerase